MTLNAPPDPCTRCGHEHYEHDSRAGCMVRFESADRWRTITYCECPAYTTEPRLTPTPREEPMTNDILATMGPGAPLEHVKMGELIVLSDVLRELHRQNGLWGEQNHPDGTGAEVPWLIDALTLGGLADRVRAATDERAARGSTTWAGILLEEAFEAVAESDPTRLRDELVQTAAVCLQWALAIDRRGEDPGVPEVGDGYDWEANQ